MKTAHRLQLGLVALAGSVSSCADGEDGAAPYVCSVTAPTACPAPALVYADVAPILERRCSSCHSGETDGPWPLTDYEHVASWWDVIRDELLTCSMPPAESDVRMTSEERLAVLTWIRCGFRE